VGLGDFFNSALQHRSGRAVRHPRASLCRRYHSTISKVGQSRGAVYLTPPSAGILPARKFNGLFTRLCNPLDQPELPPWVLGIGELRAIGDRALSGAAVSTRGPRPRSKRSASAGRMGTADQVWIAARTQQDSYHRTLATRERRRTPRQIRGEPSRIGKGGAYSQ
jgi:hypothetical protein